MSTPASASPALRRVLRAARAQLSPLDRIAAAESVGERLLALPFAPVSGLVAGYWAVDGEVGLHAWQSRLTSAQAYCLPVISDDGCLRFARWRPGEALATNRFGIPEPDVPASGLLEASELAMAVVPLVGFDPSGNRLGMGGGWYDRTFGFRLRAPSSVRLAGAAYEVQKVDALAPEQWDVRLDAVCTEAATYLAA